MHFLEPLLVSGGIYALFDVFMRLWNDLCAFWSIYAPLGGFMRFLEHLCVSGMIYARFWQIMRV